jgi:membrane dipeptidase
MSQRPVCDAHTDLLLELAARPDLEDPFGELWLSQLKDGGVRIQVCPLYAGNESSPDAALREIMNQLAAFHRALRLHPAEVFHVKTVADLDEVEGGERIGLVLALEGAECVAQNLDLLDLLWVAGVRMVGPFWALSNSFGDGNAGELHGGLTPLGHQLIQRIVERGFMLDLAHCSDATFADIVAATDVPVLVSHVGCRALFDNPRNVTDEQMRTVADRGGVVGIFALAPFMDRVTWSLESYLEHLRRAVDLLGASHVALGGDFVQQIARAGLVHIPAKMVPKGMTLDQPIVGLAGPADYQALLGTLEDAGFDPGAIESISYKSLASFLRQQLPSINQKPRELTAEGPGRGVPSHQQGGQD